MSKEKAELKMLIANNLGAQVDDMLEAAKKEHSQYEGAKAAFRNAKAKVEDLQKIVDKDVESGDITDEQRVVIKKYVNRCVGVIENLGIQAEVSTFQTSGKIQGLESTIKIIKQMYDTEKAKADAIDAGPGQLGPDVRPIDLIRRTDGAHPGNPIADRKDESVDTATSASDTSINNAKPIKKAKQGKN